MKKDKQLHIMIDQDQSIYLDTIKDLHPDFNISDVIRMMIRFYQTMNKGKVNG